MSRFYRKKLRALRKIQNPEDIDCPSCNGKGFVIEKYRIGWLDWPSEHKCQCRMCLGTGRRNAADLMAQLLSK